MSYFSFIFLPLISVHLFFFNCKLIIFLIYFFDVIVLVCTLNSPHNSYLFFKLLKKNSFLSKTGSPLFLEYNNCFFSSIQSSINSFCTIYNNSFSVMKISLSLLLRFLKFLKYFLRF
jgi:hypothetical protein